MTHMQKRTVGSGLSDDGKNPADILDTVIYEADKILIASGAAPRKLGLPGEELSEVMTSEELLQAKDRCYDRLVVVGGGVIGLEIATVFQALGSEVTVIELGERLLPSMDIEFAEALEKILVGRGIHVYKKKFDGAVRERRAWCKLSFDVRREKADSFRGCSAGICGKGTLYGRIVCSRLEDSHGSRQSACQ